MSKAYSLKSKVESPKSEVSSLKSQVSSLKSQVVFRPRSRRKTQKLTFFASEASHDLKNISKAMNWDDGAAYTHFC